MARKIKSRHKRNRTRSRTRKQKTIMMVGCSRKTRVKRGGSGCGACGCPLAPLSYKDMNKFGGRSFGPILGIGQNGGAPIPGPFVGHPYSPTNLPTMNGIGGDRNYYPPYDVTKNPQLQMKPADVDAGYLNKNSMVGGYTYGKKMEKGASSSRKRGGALIPQDLTNLGRDFTFNIQSAYNALNGYKAPVNPLPYKDQL